MLALPILIGMNSLLVFSLNPKKVSTLVQERRKQELKRPILKPISNKDFAFKYLPM